MKYMGSKRRIANELIPIIMRGRKADQWYVEPFVGGANMIDKVPGPRIGFDKNKYLIALLECIRDNPEKLPKNNKEFTEEDYKRIRAQYRRGLVPENLYYLVGFAGFCLSFGADWFGSVGRNRRGNVDFVVLAYSNAVKQSVKLKGCLFSVKDYRKLKFNTVCVIYCDPPYKDVLKYRSTKKFNHSLFYQWCRDRAKEGHKVYISEYEMPDDFKCIWEKKVVVHISKYDQEPFYKTEKLFVPIVK